MPLDPPVTIATLLSSLLIFTIVLDPRFETASQHWILHPERIVGNPEVVPRNVGEERALPPQNTSVKNIRHGASCAGPGQRQAFKNLSIRMHAGYTEIVETKDFLGCGGVLCAFPKPPILHRVKVTRAA